MMERRNLYQKNDETEKQGNYENAQNELPSSEVCFKLEHLCNGDAKLLSNQYIFTQIGGVLTVIDLDGNIVRQYGDCHVNWLDVCEEDRVIVYGNSEREIGICKYDENYDVLDNQIILNISEDAGIDPAICKVDDLWYITVTHITGNINNADLTQENGIYEIKIYCSADLKKWTEVSSVLKEKRNIEDIDLNYYEGKFYLTYEKEECDKGKSSINLLISEDKGKNWNSNIVLIEEDSDNEPACFFASSEGYCLYYSSDFEKPGSTYEGARVYVQEYDENLTRKGSPKLIPLLNSEGNLLYDVELKNKSLYCLFTQKYISESNLVLERVDNFR